MRGNPESPESPSTYRAARRAFIAACEKAHAEMVARLHPGPAPDGKPLFMDSAVLGPRRAGKAVVALAYDAKGSAMLIGLLSQPLPQDAKLVLVHAADPATFAGIQDSPAWPLAALRSVATEDLSHTRHLGILPLRRRDEALRPMLQTHLPKAVVTELPRASSDAEARAAIFAFWAAH